MCIDSTVCISSFDSFILILSTNEGPGDDAQPLTRSYEVNHPAPYRIIQLCRFQWMTGNHAYFFFGIALTRA